MQLTAYSMPVPDALMRIAAVAAELGGSVHVFQDDAIVWANEPARNLYPGVDWSGRVTFDGCFRSACALGQITDKNILRDPEDHLVFAKLARARSLNFRFRRRSGSVEYDRHHLGLDPSWNAQVWFPVRHDTLGDFTLTLDTQPWELRRHVERERALSRVAQALDGMGVALGVLSAEGTLLDASLSMSRLLRLSAGVHLDERGLITTSSADTTRRLRLAIAKVAVGEIRGAVVPLELAGISGPVHAGLLPAGYQDPAVLMTLERASSFAGTERVLAGAYGLTEHEAAVAARIATGQTAEEVARDIGRTLPTVRAQLSSVKKKVAVDRQHGLAHVLTRAATVVGGLALDDLTRD